MNSHEIEHFFYNYTVYLCWTVYLYKMDLALNKLQSYICHKTPTKEHIKSDGYMRRTKKGSSQWNICYKQVFMMLYIYIYIYVCVISVKFKWGCNKWSVAGQLQNSQISFRLTITWRLVGCVLWHINLCRLFNAKSIFMQIVSYFSNNSV